jgi:hypothetical protein
MVIIRNFITHVPVAERGGRLTALGVLLWLDPPCRIPDDPYYKISDAVAVAALKAGANMPTALHPRAWLHRCRRCKAPFIALQSARLCSDECRTGARSDSVRKASAKRSVSRSGRNETRICRHCGRETQTARATKRFCGVRCRVAWHRTPVTERAKLA